MNLIAKLEKNFHENETIEECLENIVDEAEWFDTFYDSDGMDDDGADIEEYFMVEVFSACGCPSYAYEHRDWPSCVCECPCDHPLSHHLHTPHIS